MNNTSRFGSRTGSVRSKIVWIRLKIAVLAPIPKAMETIAIAMNAGDRKKPRSAYRTSASMVCKTQPTPRSCTFYKLKAPRAQEAPFPGDNAAQQAAIGQSYWARNASSGEIKLARMAGTIDASSADSPSARIAATVTAGLYGFMP